MRLFNGAGQALMRLLNPTAPRNLPVGWKVTWLHRLALRLADRNSFKGKVHASYLQGRNYHADLAQRLIDDGQIITTTLSVAVLPYARAMWGIEVERTRISQDPHASLDLIWVATMPAARAAKPVLFFTEPQDNGPKILDGSHRLVRALLDGRSKLGVSVIDEADSHLFLR